MYLQISTMLQQHHTLAVCALVSVIQYAGGARVYLDNDGPAVIGAPIIFTARVQFDSDEHRPDTVYYEWMDTAKPQHFNRSDPTTSMTASMVLVFNDTRKFGYYTMQVKVKEPHTILPDSLIGEATTFYSITVNLNGGIKLSQPGVQHLQPDHVNTRNETQLTVVFHDPSGFLNSASRIEYFWSVNDVVNLGPFDHPGLRYNFTQVGAQFSRCIAVAHFDNNSDNSSPADGSRVGDRSLWGLFSISFYSDDPISVVNITGNNWLKHGELLNLTILCNGTGPWTYCVSVHRGKYNVTGNESCTIPISVESCQIPLIRYLSRNGTYTAVSILSNKVSKKVTPIAITVYTVVREPQLSYYIVPLSCALVALVFILFGSIKLIKSRRDYNLEIADFDFGQEDRAESFTQRVCSAFWPCRSRDNSQNTNETDQILPRGRTRRRSYGLVEDYEED